MEIREEMAFSSGVLMLTSDLIESSFKKSVLQKQSRLDLWIY